MISDALDSLRDVLSAPLRRILYRSLTLTAILLVAGWFALDALASAHVGGEGWLGVALHWAVGLGLALALLLLAAPVTSLVAGFFVDDVAAIVEAKIAPARPAGRALPLVDGLRLAVTYAPLALAVGVLALLLLFLPGVGFVLWLAANAFLLGQQYFELCAARFGGLDSARALMREHRLAAFVYGLPVAAFCAVPVVNLATPLFATALMARLVGRLLNTPDARLSLA